MVVRALIWRRRVSVSSGASRICAVRISWACRAFDQSWASSTCPIAAAACFSGNLMAPAGKDRCWRPNAIEPEEISTTCVPAARKLATSAARSRIQSARALPVAGSTISAEPILITTNLVDFIRSLIPRISLAGSILADRHLVAHRLFLLLPCLSQSFHRYGAIPILHSDPSLKR